MQAQVDAQDICPEDIDRMNADKEQLLRTLESLASAKDEASRVFWDRELQVQKHLDTVEKAVQEYTFVCERIGLLPAQAETFELSFNPHAARPDALLNIDMANVLARLGNLREEHNANIHAAQDKLLGLQESLDRLTETLTDKQDSVIHSEDKLQRMVQSYLADKESYQVYSICNYNSQLMRALFRMKIAKLGKSLMNWSKRFKNCVPITLPLFFILNNVCKELPLIMTSLLAVLLKRKKGLGMIFSASLRSL